MELLLVTMETQGHHQYYLELQLQQLQPIMATVDFMVRNDGTAPLTLGTITVPAGYSLTKALAASLAVGVSDTFRVQLNTAAAGTYAGDISFSNNDADGGDGIDAVPEEVAGVEIATQRRAGDGAHAQEGFDVV